MTYWFVKIEGKWSKPYTYYPGSKFNQTKKHVEIYEVNLENLGKRNLVWKSEV